ncbi:Uncharacterised protein [uncultured archaeon]|nr:Uncharacterised protein [uncultured archaeon]
MLKTIIICSMCETLLQHQSVINWILMGETSMILMKKSRKRSKYQKYKKRENDWANEHLELIYGDKFIYTTQWTTRFGETIVKEILLLHYENVKKPECINHFKPDFETEDAIWEVKTRNYTTNGTAGEKVLGCPLKYIDIPKLYGKKLYIVLVGYQEYEADVIFKLFDKSKMSKEKKRVIKMYKKIGIEFVKCSDLYHRFSVKDD